MRGDLGQTPAADLCRGLATAGSTGSVTIAHPSGEAGIYFRNGSVYWAESPAPRARLGDRLVNAAMLTQEQLVGALRSQAESDEHVKLGALLVERELVTRDVIRVFVQEQILDALFEIMSWRVGSYEFFPTGAAEDRLPVELSVDQMLVEVSRRQSEWDQIQVRIPSLDMVPDFVSGGSSASAALEPDEFSVLASVDGHRSIRDLAADLGYSEFEAARIVYGLALLGIVDVRGDEDEDEEAPLAEAADAADTDLELDLRDLAVADGSDAGPDADGSTGADEDDEDVDVAAALEEALYGPDDEADITPVEEDPSGPPRVKIHDGPGGFQWDALDEPVGGPLPTPPEPTPADDASHQGDDVTAALVAALRDRDDEADDDAADGDAASADSSWDDVASLDLDDEASESSDDDGPEPFVITMDEQVETTEPVEPPAAPTTDDPDFGFFAQPEDEADGDADALTDLPPPAASEDPDAAEQTPDPAPVSGADLDDRDFDRLLDELAGTGDSESTASAPYTSAPDRPRTAAGADDDMPAPPRSGSDVSEFLRELSRLAIDEPDEADEADESDAERTSGAQKAASAAADAKRTPPPPAGDDKNKKRGLFGRKR